MSERTDKLLDKRFNESYEPTPYHISLSLIPWCLTQAYYKIMTVGTTPQNVIMFLGTAGHEEVGKVFLGEVGYSVENKFYYPIRFSPWTLVGKADLIELDEDQIIVYDWKFKFEDKPYNLIDSITRYTMQIAGYCFLLDYHRRNTHDRNTEWIEYKYVGILKKILADVKKNDVVKHETIAVIDHEEIKGKVDQLLARVDYLVDCLEKKQPPRDTIPAYICKRCSFLQCPFRQEPMEEEKDVKPKRARKSA